MTSPDLPAELKAALDGKTAGLFTQRRRRPRRVDLANLPRRRRLRRHPVGNRCAGLRAGADARDLRRGHGEPERAGRDQAGLRPEQTCSMSAPGPGTATWAAAAAFPSLQDSALLDANCHIARAGAGPCSATARACATSSYERGEARAAPVKADAADLVMASYVIGEARRCRAARARRADVGTKPATRCSSSSPARPRATRGSSRSAST